MLCPDCGKTLLDTGVVSRCEPCSAKHVVKVEEEVRRTQLMKRFSPYAGFWLRFAAYVVDFAIINFVLVIFGVLIGGLLTQYLMKVLSTQLQESLNPVLFAAIVSFPFLISFLAAVLSIFLISILYKPIFEFSRFQGTPGKILIGIKVENGETKPLSFFDASLRNLLQIISAVPFMLGFLVIGLSRKKQAFHDMAVGAYVVKSGPVSFFRIGGGLTAAFILTFASSFLSTKPVTSKLIASKQSSYQNIKVPKALQAGDLLAVSLKARSFVDEYKSPSLEENREDHNEDLNSVAALKKRVEEEKALKLKAMEEEAKQKQQEEAQFRALAMEALISGNLSYTHDGKEHHFNSVDEMPENIRVAYLKILSEIAEVNARQTPDEKVKEEQYK